MNHAAQCCCQSRSWADTILMTSIVCSIIVLVSLVVLPSVGRTLRTELAKDCLADIPKCQEIAARGKL